MVGEWQWQGKGRDRLDPYMFTSVFMALGGKRANCSICLESDHRKEDCALGSGDSSPSLSLIKRPLFSGGDPMAIQDKFTAFPGLLFVAPKLVLVTVL